jgi:two-component system, sensor histidine kinase
MSVTTVLNVDDKGANRYVKSRALRSAGYEVLEAGSGRAALDLAFAHRPDLVLLDLKLPDISGFEVCRILKGDPQTSRIPVVHISSTFVGEETKSDSAQAGADMYRRS